MWAFVLVLNFDRPGSQVDDFFKTHGVALTITLRTAIPVGARPVNTLPRRAAPQRLMRRAALGFD